MNKSKNKKRGFEWVNAFIDFIFYATYIFLMVFAILDIFGINMPLIGTLINDQDRFSKILLLVFATIGIVVLNDKRHLLNKVEVSLKNIENDLESRTGDNDISYIYSKDEFYLYFTTEIRKLENGSSVLVTSFDKNQGIDYYKGENKHIEAFMDDWSSKIMSNSINVKQLVHIFTKKEAKEVRERVEKFKDCFNFSLNAMTGMPIRPYIDFIVINNKVVLISFPNDSSAPYDTGFGVAIHNEKMASEFERYFNIYWNDDCLEIKNKDGINYDNLNFFESISLNIKSFSEYKKYRTQLMRIISCSLTYKNLNDLICDLYKLSSVFAYYPFYERVKQQIDKTYNSIARLISTGFIIKKENVNEELRNILSNAQYSVKATSVEMRDNTFWTSQDGEQILSLNLKTISTSEVDIQRIFVMPQDLRDKSDELLKRQSDIGINVSVIIAELKEKLYKDFLIVDDMIVFEIKADGTAIETIKRDDVYKYIQDFEQYQRQATPLNQIRRNQDENINDKFQSDRWSKITGTII